MSPWASASSATLRGEPPGPDRPQAREPRPQEGVAGRRHDLVHHGQRAEPSGDTSPWQTLAARPARPTRQGGREPSGGARAMCGMAQALQVPRPSSGGSLGSRSARMGPPGTRHRQQAVGVCPGAHGQRPAGCAGAGAGGQGAPNDTPRPQAVADGAEESEAGQAVSTRRRPAGAGPAPADSRAPRDPAHAAAVPRASGGGWRKGQDASWCRMPTESACRCGAVCGDSRTPGAQRGGWSNRLRHCALPLPNPASGSG